MRNIEANLRPVMKQYCPQMNISTAGWIQLKNDAAGSRSINISRNATEKPELKTLLAVLELTVNRLSAMRIFATVPARPISGLQFSFPAPDGIRKEVIASAATRQAINLIQKEYLPCILLMLYNSKDPTPHPF